MLPACIALCLLATPPTTAPAEDLLARLSSPSDAIRRAAADDLASLGTAALPAMKRAFRGAASYDVRHRIMRIAEKILVEDRVGPPAAFLGISHRAVALDADAAAAAPPTANPAGRPDTVPRPADTPDPPDPPPPVGVHIMSIVRGSAAAEAGLRPGDIIVDLNGGPITSTGETRNSFVAWIAEQPPGTTCQLRVRRGNAELPLTVRLGRHPYEYWYPQAADRLAAARAEFPDWWRREFDPGGDMLVDLPSDEDPAWSLDPKSR